MSSASKAGGLYDGVRMMCIGRKGIADVVRSSVELAFPATCATGGDCNVMDGRSDTDDPRLDRVGVKFWVSVRRIGEPGQPHCGRPSSLAGSLGDVYAGRKMLFCVA
jgi:hypothetical protein